MMGKQEQQRTGLFTLRREVEMEHPADRKGQTTELFTHLTRRAHAQLVKATDDRRGYQAVVEIRMRVLVSPSQAEVGEYVEARLLQEDGRAGMPDGHRFEQDGQYWKRVE